ncbi:leucine--tRNA ligase [bacterium]|nr:leucine--tRNA ligase [bacterium]
MLYDPSAFEQKWRDIWEEKGLHHAVKNDKRPKYYCLDMFPYPSGEGLHVGHWRGYVLSDVVSRYMTLNGYQVLHPMGWDAFGLPAENAAIKKKIHPVDQTLAATTNMRRQLKDMGSMYDWEREVNSSTPEYYKWTQWTFLKAYELGLAYKKDSPINWCPSCATGLADEEVKDGRCERCDSVVTKKNLSQWFFAISKYAQRLIDDIKDLDWPEKVKKMQTDWIGRSEGAKVTFKLEGCEDTLEIFTTRPDTLYGVSYMVLAPEHELVAKLTSDAQREEVEKYVAYASTKSAVERQERREKTGVFTGAYALNPVNGQKVPIWIADYVLMDYGTGAIMAVPAHDERDWEFAKAFNLPIRQVVMSAAQAEALRKDGIDFSDSQAVDKAWQEKFGAEPYEEAYCEYGVMVNSQEFSGCKTEEGKKAVIAKLEKAGIGKAVVNYRLRDWLISRQRYWGAPIPMVYCDKCGIVPVPEDQLPVLLPHVKSYEPSGTGASPLAAIDSFVNTACPKCGAPAKRDTDTLSQWICSSWYYLRYASYDCKDKAWRREDIDYWNPVDLYVGGIEHAVLHLLYSRFYTKMFYDLGLVGFKEPFKRLFNQGMITRMANSGRLEKMSKSKGNSVNPDDLVKKYGTDALRSYLLFIGPPEMDAEWNDSGIEGVYRWLRRVWTLVTEGEITEGAEKDGEVLKVSHKYIKRVNEDLSRLHLNTMVASLMEWANFLIGRKAPVSRETVEQYLIMLAPVAPHMAEELWAFLGHKEGLFESRPAWPQHEEKHLHEDDFNLVVQINGKVRENVRVSKALSKEELEEVIKARPKIAAALEGKTLRKVVYVPGKLMNLVVG